LVATIYDFNYHSFKVDVLAKFIDADGTLSLRRTTGAMSTIIAIPKLKRAENNIQMLIEEAFIESSSLIPVMFLISHSVNVQNELQAFHRDKHLGTKFIFV
jgi:serine protease inhibitor ecotin